MTTDINRTSHNCSCRALSCTSSQLVLCLLSTLLAFNANSAEVSKSAWLESMSTALPIVFCKPEQYFRQCFNISAQQCETTAASATRICLDKHAASIPDTLVQPKDGAHWGQVVGSCAGEAYEVSLKAHRSKDSRCNNPANWY